MRLASIAEIKARLSEYVEHCRREAVVVTKHGHPRAALVPLRDENDLERLLLSQNPRFLALLARSARSGRLSLSEAERALAEKKPGTERTSGRRRRARVSARR